MKSYQFAKNRMQLQARLIEMIRSKLDEDKIELVIELLNAFLAVVSDEDLEQRSDMDLLGAILVLFELMQNRQPIQTKIHAFNPSQEQFGWQSPHTVIMVNAPNLPFLIPSMRMVLDRFGLNIYWMVSPVALAIQRENGQLLHIEIDHLADKKEQSEQEIVIYFEVDQQVNLDFLSRLEESMIHVANDIKMAASAYPLMKDRLEALMKNLAVGKKTMPETEFSEYINFLKWLWQGHFLMLGIRHYQYGEKPGDPMHLLVEQNLGIFQQAQHAIWGIPGLLPHQNSSLFSHSSQLLQLAKSNQVSHIHHPGLLDIIAIRQLNEKGKLIGEVHLLGLYTASAYSRPLDEIPLLRRKQMQVIERSLFSKEGFIGKSLLFILENLPRDEVFLSDVDQLFELCMGIFQICERRQTRLFLRQDNHGHFISCFVFTPRELFTSGLRARMGEVLVEELGAQELEFNTSVTSSALARIHFILRYSQPEALPKEYDIKRIESRLVECARSWNDDLMKACEAYFGSGPTAKLNLRYQMAFPAAYREEQDPRTAVLDIDQMEQLDEKNTLGLSIYRRIEEGGKALRLKLFHRDDAIILSEVLPILENMGLTVITSSIYKVRRLACPQVHIVELQLLYQGQEQVDITRLREKFRQAFCMIWFKKVGNDALNRLVLKAELDWRQINLLRAYARYLRQIGFALSQQYIAETLAKHAHLTCLLLRLIHVRFSPAFQGNRANEADKIQQEILSALDAVVSLDEDRILRHYLTIMNATIRTNFYQESYQQGKKDFISFKLLPEKIIDAPLPKPKFEIFVYSPRFEGVHLRCGLVARGGLRWSDRREDYRTEILDLMTAQHVKNAVIVPTGAKGGFVTKRIGTLISREARQQEGIECYQDFIRGLLDITDNVVDGEVIPAECVRYDGNDPYLVVAADKGTATFSDIANGVAKEYFFWLGDAFASGGSAGYDHKRMGITARTAWVSVERHFRSLGKNIQQDAVTVIGIGDMSGDVFGNGMLLSRTIRLLGAFNHLHIFIDPDPDEEKSYQERQRLFDLPRSSWIDYSSELISTGGGVFSRQAKSITLSDAMRQMLCTTADRLTPNEVINLLLQSKVDLLWSGGIGTYVKSTQERDVDVGDRSNDALRINGSQLNASVVGEGGNLGLTPLARVEYELKGGICFCDFIDNVGGVDCSDHEVNIKIFLDALVKAGDLTLKQRNQLLVDMQSEVSDLVLANAYHQSQALSVAHSRGLKGFSEHLDILQTLEQAHILDRTIAGLPTDAELAERIQTGTALTRPELAHLLAGIKILIKEELRNSPLLDHPFLVKLMAGAFPKQLHDRFSSQMQSHYLRTAITANQLSNTLVNEMGMSFYHRLHDEIGCTIPDMVAAYCIARHVFHVPLFVDSLKTLDHLIDASVQNGLFHDLSRLIRRATRWYLSNYRVGMDLQMLSDLHEPLVHELWQSLPEIVAGLEQLYINKKFHLLEQAGLPETLAFKMSTMETMFSALDIIQAAQELNSSVADVGKAYFEIGAQLELDWLREQISVTAIESNWDALARASFKDDIDSYQRALTIAVFPQLEDSGTINEQIAIWLDKYQWMVARWQHILQDMRAEAHIDYIAFSLAMRELLALNQIVRAAN